MSDGAQGFTVFCIALLVLVWMLVRDSRRP